MALVIRGSGFDDLFAYGHPYGYGGGYGGGYGSNLVSFSAYNAYNPFAPAAPQRALAAAVAAKSFNPFKSTLPNYGGQIGAPNNIRPQLRPPNDRLDRLTRLAVEKLDLGSQALRGLADDADRLKAELRDADTGGEADLREQLRLANMEIHRLRTIMLTGVGKEQEEEELIQQQYYQQQGGLAYPDGGAVQDYPGEPGEQQLQYGGGEQGDQQDQYDQYQQEQIAYGAAGGNYGEGQEGTGQIQYEGYGQ